MKPDLLAELDQIKAGAHDVQVRMERLLSKPRADSSSLVCNVRRCSECGGRLATVGPSDVFGQFLHLLRKVGQTFRQIPQILIRHNERPQS